MAEPYTLTEADVDGCRKILAKLTEFDQQLGGYYVGAISGHQKSATATVHYERGGDPMATAAAVSYALENIPNLGHLCKKVIAHYETHSEVDGG